MKDLAELDAVEAGDLDGVLWLDRCRVAREGKRYVLRDTVTNRVLSRHDLIDSALAEAKRFNREAFR